uniref:SET domain-containing protein n=1 Tax=Ditylum brightwellii TaxID=49249 RepID=A0A7S4SHD5_9STRA
MDALDPQVNIPFAEVLYKQPTFLQAVYDSLSEQGVIVMQLGDAPGIFDPSDAIGRNENRAIITEHLLRMGFQSVHVYEEMHSNFGEPWTYLVAMKDYTSRSRWYSNAAQIEVAIQKRIKHTYSGKSALRFFDGATMMTYQTPHKAFEVVYCRNIPMPAGCDEATHGFSKSRPNAPVSSFEVKASQVGDHAGRGVFAKIDIPKGAHIGVEQSMNSINVASTTYDIALSLAEEYDLPDLDAALEYLWGYGFESNLYGETSVVVDSTILTFVNHGCNGTYNAATVTSTVTEMTTGVDEFDEAFFMNDPYNLVVARHLPHNQNSGDVALRDIKAGEEILNNYLDFSTDEENWKDYVRNLRNQCLGKVVGSITNVERGGLPSMKVWRDGK